MYAARVSGLLLLLSLSAIGGCGKKEDVEFGSVTGTLMIDGQTSPAGVKLVFDPLEKGVRGSIATTDESGFFEAVYSASRNGVRTGACVIKLEPPLVVPKTGSGKPKLPYPEKYYEEIQQVNVHGGHTTLELKISKAEN
ncbi:hypothetical protein [Blastopirellula retiformator]|uniref:Carboxypeptidase regulatory-like domain-containing protein n=1 Tax=Blastopirellula retiformator TaxID=2527970 RepID=A0A5C5VLF9_9BACT|nr:hypothetical protein [Blastopirellula retiformator]TWT39466.1 hypothetical protein Enr8_11650 [Blastopirellula retiformator]